MPRVRRKGNAPRFQTGVARRVWEIVRGLHAQRKKHPAGPWMAPRSFAGLLAVRQFRQETLPMKSPEGFPGQPQC
jgi:hypothetical protein